MSTSSNKHQVKSRQAQEFLSLCKDGTHQEVDAMFQAFPDAIQRLPAVAIGMARSFAARAWYAEEGQVLSNALNTHNDNRSLYVYYIAHLIHAGDAKDAAVRVARLGDEIEVSHAVMLAKAFEQRGDVGLALEVLYLCKDKISHVSDGSFPMAGRYYAKLLVECDPVRALVEINQMRDEYEVCIYPDLLFAAQKKILRANMYRGDVEGASEAINQYVFSCGNLPTVDQLCVIADNWAEVGDVEKARKYFDEIIRQLTQIDELLLESRSLQLLGALSRKLEARLPEYIVEQIMLRYLRDIKNIQSNDLIFLANFAQDGGYNRNIQAVLSELLGRPLAKVELFAALRNATFLGNSELIRRFTQKIKEFTQSQKNLGVSSEHAGILHEDLGVNGYLLDSNEVMLIFNSLMPAAIGNIVEALLKKNVSPIMVNDFQRNLHLSGLGPHPESLVSSARELKAFLSGHGCTRIHVMGLSGGGLSALLYADALSAATCLALSPPSYLPACSDSSDVRGLALRRKIEKLGLLKDADVVRRFALDGEHPNTHVYYPSHSKADVYHAERLRSFDHVTLIPQEGAEHVFWSKWDNYRWRKAFDELL